MEWEHFLFHDTFVSMQDKPISSSLVHLVKSLERSLFPQIQSHSIHNKCAKANLLIHVSYGQREADHRNFLLLSRCGDILDVTCTPLTIFACLTGMYLFPKKYFMSLIFQIQSYLCIDHFDGYCCENSRTDSLIIGVSYQESHMKCK